ncbi:MAG: hypothetical protein ACM3MJ_00665 [Deltaproteobacteria bacterium]
MFMVQDMLMEAVIVTVVLLVVLLSTVVLATAGRDWMEQRRAQAAKSRLRRRVWNEYAAACTPLRPQTASAAPSPATPRAGLAARPVERQSGLSTRPAKA